MRKGTIIGAILLFALSILSIPAIAGGDSGYLTADHQTEALIAPASVADTVTANVDGTTNPQTDAVSVSDDHRTISARIGAGSSGDALRGCAGATNPVESFTG